MRIQDLDTPALLFDMDQVKENIAFMQGYADRKQVHLRPHTKTHKCPYLAKLQVEAGAFGIAVAKVAEAEVMAAEGLDNIFIANEVVGRQKFARIAKLMEDKTILFGLDSIDQARLIEESFKDFGKEALVLIEIEVGEERSGMVEMQDFIDLLSYLDAACPHIRLKGIFSHDGNSYNAKDLEDCARIHRTSQARTLAFAKQAEAMGHPLEIVSIGSTPSLMQDFDILEGITEIRPGTYILMDASQGNAYGSQDMAAATVLATVMSRPTAERVILDVGAKGITMQSRHKGICAVDGMGFIQDFPSARIFDVFDEHAILYNKAFRDRVALGDKVRIVPMHICPVVNLHDRAYLVSKDEVLGSIDILCRGKLT